MFRFVSILLVSVALQTVAGEVTTDTIEESELGAIPPDADKAIRSHALGKEFRDCNFKGTDISLSPRGQKGLFVTTTEACNWGAAQGPIVILREQGGKYIVLIKTVGYSAKLVPDEKDKDTPYLLEIRGQHLISEYKLIGDQYIKVKADVR